MQRLQAAVNDKLAQWDREAILNMANYIKATGATPLLVTYPTGVQRVRVEFVESRPGRGLHQSYATPYLDPGFVQFDTYNIEYRYMECSLAAYLAKQERWQLPAVFDDEAATDAACVRNPYM